MPYIPPETLEEAREAILRTRAKNAELLAEIAHLKRQRDEARARAAELESYGLHELLERFICSLGYEKVKPEA